MADQLVDKTPTKKKVSFSPPDLLKVNNADPNYTYRWISASNKVNFWNGQDSRGWEIVRWGSKNQEDNKELNGLLSQFAPTAVGSIVRVGEHLVLARMPKERADAIKEHYVEKSRQRVRAVTQPKRDISAEDQGQFLGDVKTWKETKI